MPTLAVPARVRAPGWRSDLGLHGALGSLEEIEEGWRCELPSVPKNPFGTMLVLSGSPSTSTPKAAVELFERYFAGSSAPQVCIGWDDPDAEVHSLAPFVAHGLVAIDDVALALRGSELSGGRPPEPGHASVLRLDLERDASRVLACELAVDQARAHPYGPAAVARNLTWCGALVDGGAIGGWYGAEVDGQIVSTLGIVSVGGEGRLQSVGTRPRYRNRGIARALLAWAWKDAAARLELDRLVLVTARGGPAEGWYRRMGFVRIGGSLGVMGGRSRTRSGAH